MLVDSIQNWFLMFEYFCYIFVQVSGDNISHIIELNETMITLNFLMNKTKKLEIMVEGSCEII